MHSRTDVLSRSMSSSSSAPTAIITGGSGDIGAAGAEMLAGSGWNVVINYSQSQEKAEAVAAVCRAHCVERDYARTVHVSVADDGDCRRIAQLAMEVTGVRVA